MNQKTVFIKTFGCQMNERDSEILLQSLAGCGYLECMDMESADLVILNTCSIRAKAEQKVMSLLGYLRKTKQSRPGMKICVAGCVAQQEGKKLIARMPHVDLIVGTQQIYDICKHLEIAESGGSRIATSLQDHYAIPSFLPSSSAEDSTSDNHQFSRFVTIMQGCNNYCTYCVVPYTRGRETSRNVKDIVKECEVLIESGVSEIILLGQNVNSYGKTNPVQSDNASYGFSDLLHTVSNLDGLKRLRFTTSNPKDLGDDLIDCFNTIECLCPQFHLPVQSGSNKILSAMNRKYSIEQYLKKVHALREVCPDIALTTDIIVGFPGETEEDFEETMNLLDTVRYHGSFSFKYSDRPGTRASQLENKVEENIKSERLSRFQKRQDEISLARNQEYVGQDKTVLIEKAGKDGARGRTDTNHIVHFQGEIQASPGELVVARIIHAGQHSLIGQPL